MVTKSELAVGEYKIAHALGLVDLVEDNSEVDSYFKSYIALGRSPIIVSAGDLAPEDDHRLDWVLAYGLDSWQGFVRRMQAEGRVTLTNVNAGGRRKVKLRQTDQFNA